MLVLLIVVLTICMLTSRHKLECFWGSHTNEHFDVRQHVPVNNPEQSAKMRVIDEHQNDDVSNDNVKDKCDITTCDTKTCGKQLYPVTNPEFNMREVAKQCLLLEDHLNNTKKRCIDCIKKHFLIIDGLLEEAVSLEKDNEVRNKYRDLFLQWVTIEKNYASNHSDVQNMDEVSKKIRLFRKPLVEQYFDNVSTYSE